MVLRTFRLGESDRIVVLVTEHNGKVRAVAKGISRTKSRFGARLEPFSHVNLMLYKGRDLDIVTQVETINKFTTIRTDLDRLIRASCMTEAVDLVSQEREVNPQLYKMLVGALSTLDNSNSSLILGGFYWKLLSLDGAAPAIDFCVQCGSRSSLVKFDFSQGGILCHNCTKGQVIDPFILELIKKILTNQLAAALNEATEDQSRQIETLGLQALESHLERNLKSMGVLGRH